MQPFTFICLLFGGIGAALTHPRTRIRIGHPGFYGLGTSSYGELTYATNPFNPFALEEEHISPCDTPVEERVRRALEREFAESFIVWSWVYGHPSRALPPFWRCRE